MKVWSSPLGAFPRNRIVRKALRDHERGLLSYDELDDLVFSSSLTLIGAQIASGMTYVVDGMLDWHDIFRPFVSAWRNVTPTGLLRYFDNNFFYRIPFFVDKPEPVTAVWAPRVRRYLPFVEPAGFKVVVPGPVTFAYMSKSGPGLSREELAHSIAELLSSEVGRAVEAGAVMVQIDEPLLSDPEATPDMAVLASELASKIASRAGNSKTVLAVYYGVPRADVYEKLLDSKTSCLSLDVGDNLEKATELLSSKGFGTHCAVLGLVNSRVVYEDRLDLLVDVASRILKEYDGEEVGLTTTTWLDLIPYSYSLAKIKLLGFLADKISLKLGGERVLEVVKQ